MDFSSNRNDGVMHSDLLPLDASRQFLDEVRQATQGTEPCELHEFAGLVSHVLELHQAAGDDCSADGEFATFVTTCLDAIRAVIEADQPSSELLSSLRDQMIERWGDQLTPLVDWDLNHSDSDHDHLWEINADSDSQSEDNEPVAPSAEQITALLSSLGQSTHIESAPRPTTSTNAHEGDQAARSPDATIASLDSELRDAFLDDANGCVSSMEESLLRLESDPNDAAALNQICRELHTLKGASASVGLTSLADQLHTIEDVLRDDQTAGRSPCIESLLRSVDSIRLQISGDQQDIEASRHLSAVPEKDRSSNTPEMPVPASHPAPASAPMSQLGDLLEGSSDDESVRVKSSQLNRLMDMLAELVMLRNRRDTELSELQEIYHELIGSASKMRLLSNDGNSQDAASSLWQLSEVANDVLEVAQKVRDCAQPVAEGNAAVSQFIRQFRQELVELRRTPVSGLFRRLQRVVRDAAQSESKDVRLLLVGENASIERTLQQRLYEPLLHIVRNSVCHGIETTEERTRAGKNPVGTITLDAHSGPDLFAIEIRDDGRGLDYEAIRRRGVESGLLVADQAVSRAELAQLIFQPGFSTRDTASQIAGRGVGMDVVASTLQRMRGWLEVDSEPEQGTRIRLSFPLPSVIQHAMVFRSAGQLFALPMQSVQSAGEVERDTMFLCFSELLGSRQPQASETCQRIVLAYDVRSANDASRGSARVTLLVDEIVGPEEVVVRPLPPLVRHHPFCSGATLSGMGQPVLLLDIRRMVESQSRHLRSHEQTRKLHDANPAQDSRLMRPRVLVVDDSLSARKRVVRSLQRFSVEVVEASDGDQALEILKTQQVTAVFSDMEMPRVSGMELLAEINSPDRDESPPVVIISSRGEDEYIRRAKELGANSYLIKPLADEALDQALSGIPSLRHLAMSEKKVSGTFSAKHAQGRSRGKGT